MNHLLCHCFLKTDYKLLYTFGNNCGTEKTQCFLSSDIWIPYFVNVWFQKLKYLYPLHGRLFDLHPPPPGFSVPGGFWWPPSPQEFPEFLNGDFAYLPGYQRFFSRAEGIFSVGQRPTHLRPEYRLPSFENSKWFWCLKTKKVNTNSVTKVR